MPPNISCREIADSDVPRVADLLAHGFPSRARSFWLTALTRLANRPAPAGCPTYGHMLARDDEPVGVILTIFSEVRDGGARALRCNLSSWYVLPDFRCYASMLTSRAMARKDATYVNVTPSLHTLPLIEALGYTRYCSGRFLAVAALRPFSPRTRITVVGADSAPPAGLPDDEARLLADHGRCGCISVVCTYRGEHHPFIFSPGPTTRAPAAYLAYCRDVADFVRFAGPLGRFLAWRGLPLVMLDANGPVPGLLGRYIGERDPKYYKGASPPRLGDLSYTERALFGV